VLEACSVSDPESGLIRLRCPRCEATALARLADGRLELGAVAQEGAGGFRPSTVATEPDLFVRREAAWVDCWHGKVYRRFPVGA
jgi:hypothetical protein